MSVHEPVSAPPVAAAQEEATPFLRLSALAPAEPRSAPVNPVAAWLMTLVETVTIVTASVVSGIAYSWFLLDYIGDLQGFAGIGVLVAVMFSGVMRLRAGGGLSSRRGIDAIADASFTWCGVFVFLSLVAFMLKVNDDVSRGAVLVFFVVGLFAVSAARALLPRAIAALTHKRALAGDNVLLIGADGDPAIDALKREVTFTGAASVTVLTVDAGCNERDWKRELAAGLSRILISARVTGYGQICVAGSGFSSHRLAALIAGMQQIPRAIRLVPDADFERLLRMPIRNLGRMRAVELQRAPMSRSQRWMKRVLDLAVAVPATIILSPLLASVALAIKLDSKGPVFFKQERLGRMSRPFTILKFRSMTVMENGDTVVQATKGDARVTRVGRIIRAASLDELPQLINVIMGDMSLVGPRPHAMAHDKLYATLIDNYELRQHVKPGITGWAQVNGLRGQTADVEAMRARVEHDVWYAKNASVPLDVQIIARTFVEVLRARNAY